MKAKSLTFIRSTNTSIHPIVNYHMLFFLEVNPIVEFFLFNFYGNQPYISICSLNGCIDKVKGGFNTVL